MWLVYTFNSTHMNLQMLLSLLASCWPLIMGACKGEGIYQSHLISNGVLCQVYVHGMCENLLESSHSFILGFERQ